MFLLQQLIALLVLLFVLQPPWNIRAVFLLLRPQQGLTPRGVSLLIPKCIFRSNLPSNSLGLNISIHLRIYILVTVRDINYNLIIFHIINDASLVTSITTVTFIREMRGSIGIIIMNADIIVGRRNSIQHSSKILMVWALSSIHRWGWSDTWS